MESLADNELPIYVTTALKGNRVTPADAFWRFVN